MIIRSSYPLHLKQGTQSGGIHPFHEILYIVSGEVELQWMGSVSLFNRHSLLLLTPNTPHQVRIHSPEASLWFLELDMEQSTLFPTLEQSLTWNQLQRSLANLRLFESVYFRTLQIITEEIGLIKENKEDIYYKEIMKLDIQKLLYIIQALLSNQESGPQCHRQQLPDHKEITSLMRYMETNYRQPITLETLSELAHLDPSYLIRSFRKLSGTTPLQYLKVLRLNAATSYLATTNMSIEQVANACGYDSLHYFSQLFKKTFGTSPSRWRANAQKLSN